MVSKWILLETGWISIQNYFVATYGISFQNDGFMNDESVDVWAKSKFDFPELTSFTICTWVKFAFEVNKIIKM